MSWDWSISDEELEFHFPEKKGDHLTFMGFLWNETKAQIKNLPEISYDEIPELLE